MSRPRLVSTRAPLRRWWVGVLIYAVVGVTWVIVSDVILFSAQDEPRLVSIAKGTAYVLLSAAVASLVLARVRHEIDQRLVELEAREADIARLGANSRDLLYLFETEPEPRFTFVSDVAEEIVGYTPQDHYDDPTLGRRIVHPDDLHLLDDPAAMTGSLRCRWRHRNGRVVWCEQQNRLRFEDGRLVGIVGSARDVTADVLRTEAADATAQLAREIFVEERGLPTSLHRLAETLLTLFEAAAVRIEITAVGPVCTGHTAQARTSDPATTSVPALQPATTGATCVEITATSASPDPTLIEGLLGELAARIDELHDAQYRDKQIQQLQQLKQALEASASAVMLTDHDGKIQWVNRAFTAVTGYSREEVVGQTPRILNSGVQDAAFYARLWETISAGRSFASRFINRRRDGTTFTAEVTIDPVLDHEGHVWGYVGVQKDVTAEEEERARVHRRELEALAHRRDIERDRSLLVQTISHELRTPLTIVLGVADTLSNTDVDHDSRHALREALDRAKGQVLGRLDVLLAATDGVDGPAESVPVRALVEAALDGLWRPHDVSRVTLNGDACWSGQRPLAKALLAPLLDNALKYAPVGAPVRVAIERCDAGVLIMIHDAGPGIPQSALERLREPFQQADAGSTREHGGLGLGLYSAHRVADRLGGTLTFNTGSDGTEVRVWLPDDAEVSS